MVRYLLHLSLLIIVTGMWLGKFRNLQVTLSTYTLQLSSSRFLSYPAKAVHSATCHSDHRRKKKKANAMISKMVLSKFLTMYL